MSCSDAWLKNVWLAAAWQAIKNAAELEGMVEAHLRDGVALAQFLAWLEHKARGPGFPGLPSCCNCASCVFMG